MEEKVFIYRPRLDLSMTGKVVKCLNPQTSAFTQDHTRDPKVIQARAHKKTTTTTTTKNIAAKDLFSFARKYNIA